MQDPTVLIIIASVATAGLAIASAAALKGWSAWLELRRMELASPGETADRSTPCSSELSDLRERVRRLEAIASGAQ